MTVAPKKSPAVLPVAAAAPVSVASASASPLPFEPAKMFETVAAPAREMQENLRKAAEMRLEETRAAYARVKTVAEDATQSLEKSYAAAYQGFTALNAKAVDAMRANVEAGAGLFKALTGAKSLTEAMEVQSGHARKLFDALTFQAKDMATMAQKIAADAVAPIKASVSKAMTQAN